MIHDFKEKKGLLLTEVFRNLINTQNNGHQGSILGGFLSKITL